MKRTEYLAQLERYLKRLPKEDYDEVMDYFVELFDDAGAESEEELIAGLGSPKEAAHEIMSNLLDKKLSGETGEKSSRRNLVLIVILAMLAAPVGLPLLAIPFLMMLALVMLTLSVIVAIAATSLTAFLFGAALLWDSLPLFLQSLPAFLLGFGAGLLAIGISCLLLLGIFYLVRFGVFALIRMGQFFITKMRRGA